MAVVAVEAGVEVQVVAGAGACVELPSYRSGKSAGAGTRSGDSWCGRCDYMAVSYRLLPCPHDR